MSYLELLQNPKWQKRRLEIMERSNFECENCGDSESQLQVHHKRYISGRKPWEYDNEMLQCLCISCHELVTSSHITIKDILSEMGPHDLELSIHALRAILNGNYLVLLEMASVTKPRHYVIPANEDK